MSPLPLSTEPVAAFILAQLLASAGFPQQSTSTRGDLVAAYREEGHEGSDIINLTKLGKDPYVVLVDGAVDLLVARDLVRVDGDQISFNYLVLARSLLHKPARAVESAPQPENKKVKKTLAEKFHTQDSRPYRPSDTLNIAAYVARICYKKKQYGDENWNLCRFILQELVDHCLNPGKDQRNVRRLNDIVGFTMVTRDQWYEVELALDIFDDPALQKWLD